MKIPDTVDHYSKWYRMQSFRKVEDQQYLCITNVVLVNLC